MGPNTPMRWIVLTLLMVTPAGAEECPAAPDHGAALASLIAKVVEIKPSDTNSMARLLGDRRAERFGKAFLNVLKAS